MVRPSTLAPQSVDPVDDLTAGVLPSSPTSSGYGRERILDVLRADGLRFRDGARWRPVL